MAKRRPTPPEPGQHLTPTDVIANALNAAGLPPRPESPGVRHFRLNSLEAEEALYDPRKREFGYVPPMLRPMVVWEES